MICCIVNLFNKNTYPEFSYEQYGLLHNKKSSVRVALKVAEKRWNTIERGEFTRDEINPSIYTISASASVSIY